MSKTILVTGASRGLGLGITEHLLKKEHQVFAVTRQADSPALQTLQKKYPQHLHVVVASVSDPAGRASVREQVLLKSKHLDWVINNAGIYPEGDDDLNTITPESLRHAFEVNTITPIFVIRELMPLLKKSQQPKTFHVTSLMGSLSDNTSGGSYGYRMSKAALNMAVKSLAIDFPDIASILLHPGWVRTDMGGDQAPTTIDESVSGMITVMERSGLRQTGQFFDYEGDSIAW